MKMGEQREGWTWDNRRDRAAQACPGGPAAGGEPI